MRLNCEAQVSLIHLAAPHLSRSSPQGRIVLVTSNQAHLYPSLELEPGYEPIAASKQAGERAVRLLIPKLQAMGVRVVVASSDGRRPLVTEIAAAIACGITDPDLLPGQNPGNSPRHIAPAGPARRGPPEHRTPNTRMTFRRAS
jgi:NAD(P)-dependent dehydrogenase (short-subunit alcohol dehydrogenase family)